MAACRIAAAILPLTASAQPPVTQAPAGTTPATAIMLPHVADEFHGVVAEQTYIAQHFPTWHIEYQTTLVQNDRRYDLLGMVKPDQTKVALYFDITEWAGK